MANRENEIVKAAAKLLYDSLPTAEFNRTSLEGLAMASERGEQFDNLPARIKLPVYRLVLACRLVDVPGLVPDEATPAAITEDVAPIVDAEVVAPKVEESAS